MSLLSVSSIQNSTSPTTNVRLNTDGTVTLAVFSGAAGPTPTQAGTLWFDTGSATLQVRNAANTAWIAAGGGLPVATFAEAAAGTLNTVVLTPETGVPKDAAGMTGAALLPSGTTAQQPGAPVAGMTRFNSTTGDFEFYTGSAWNGATAKVLGAGATYDEGASLLPSGTTAQRPAAPVAGMTRVNTTTDTPETYINGSWSPIQSTQSGQFAGFRNILINGNFSINQRQYVSGTATTAANEYTLDRWNVITSGQSVTFSASGNGNQVTAPAGGLEQLIEDVNVGGGVYTLSWTGTATATVNGTAVVNGGQVTLPANTQASVVFSGGTVSQAQLEPGGVASPFEQRTIGIELVLCQRYYQSVPYTIFTNASVTGRWAVSIPFGVQMRATASVLSENFSNCTKHSTAPVAGGVGISAQATAASTVATASFSATVEAEL